MWWFGFVLLYLWFRSMGCLTLLICCYFGFVIGSFWVVCWLFVIWIGLVFCWVGFALLCWVLFRDLLVVGYWYWFGFGFVFGGLDCLCLWLLCVWVVCLWLWVFVMCLFFCGFCGWVFSGWVFFRVCLCSGFGWVFMFGGFVFSLGFGMCCLLGCVVVLTAYCV